MSGDEDDSRTASVGVPRTQTNGSNAASRSSSTDSKMKRKRGRRNGGMAKTDVNDIVPRGGNFSNAPLNVDGESDSDSTSSSDESAGPSPQNAKEQTEARRPQAQAGAAPAVNWNKATRSGIRTSLGPKAKQSAFEAVNNKYFRSRSASATSDEEQPSAGEEKDHNDSDNNKPYYMDDSENSDTDVSEGGDSIMLNIRPRNDGASEKREETADEPLPFTFDSQPDPDAAAAAEVDEEESENSSETSESSSQILGAKTFPTSKEAAFKEFAELYPSPPTTLADLRREDLEVQARFFYSGQEIGELDLSRNIACTECLQDGHLSIVCPTRECEHCGAWNQHESKFCPSYRRCQKCRERGHDASECKAPLKGSATEVPCDFCGSETHLEDECDLVWKFPPPALPYDGPVTVSISCSYCISQSHLMGDCPSLPTTTRATSWSLKGYDMSKVTNLNSVVGPRPAKAGPANNKRNNRNRHNRAASPTYDSDSDDNLLAQAGRQRNNLSIRGAGGNRGGRIRLANDGRGFRPPSPSYRDRDDRSHRPRQRRRSQSPPYSRAPPPPPPPPPRRSPTPPPPPPPPHDSSRRGGRGRPPPPPWLGRGGGVYKNRGRGGGRDAYRPRR